MSDLKEFYEKNSMIIYLALIFLICYLGDIPGKID